MVENMVEHSTMDSCKQLDICIAASAIPPSWVLGFKSGLEIILKYQN